MTDESALNHTPLHAMHLDQGGRMVAFAGYEMPVQFAAGVMKEHRHTRAAAGLFDVSHMGQIRIRARSGAREDAARALERLTPADIVGLPPGRQRYALFTNESGGLLDDFMVSAAEDHLFLVVNAACKDDDLAHLRAHLEIDCEVEPLRDRALLALQGPRAEEALASLVPAVVEMRFMDFRVLSIAGAECLIARSGYTGEDGFEISVQADRVEELACALLAHEAVEPIGLGARDSLRLEAGLCLYGSDIGLDTTPVEAGLTWSIGKARRADGERAGGFPGADIVLSELAGGPSRRRVGLRPEGRAPVRAGAALFADENDETPIGRVTSGVFGPSVEAPVAMAYAPSAFSQINTTLFADVRGRRLPVRVAALPFVPHRYKRAQGDLSNAALY